MLLPPRCGWLHRAPSPRRSRDAANGGNPVDNWQNGTGEYRGRTAPTNCAGATPTGRPPPPPRLRRRSGPPPPPPPPPPPAPVAPAARRPPPRPAPRRPPVTKVTFAADAFFDFDKAVLKPEGRAKLDDLVGKIKGINLEVIIAVGHTDSVGTDAYNQKLSVRRAEAVKAYLVSKGVEKNRVYTEGKGEKQPVADNKTAEGRAKNRRVEIEVVGTAHPHNRLLEMCTKARLGGAFFHSRHGNGRAVRESPAAPCADDTQRRPAGTGQVLRAGPPLVGPGQRVPAAARDQSAAPRTGSTAWPAWPASGCSTSAAAAASWPTAMARRGAERAGHRPGRPSRSRWRNCMPWRPARRTSTTARSAAEALAAEQPGSFDVVTCMEMLEHVPDPASVVQACATLVKPGGWVFFSTINRNAKASCSRSSAPSTC